MNETLVTSYVNPDLDGTACMVAYSELLNKLGITAVAQVSGEPHIEALWVLQKFNINPPVKITDINRFDKIIQVDNSLINNLHPGLDIKKIVEVIDHRKVNDADQFTNAKIQIELVGSAATLITEKFKQKNIAPSPQAATLLAAAVISNTLNFQSTAKTDRDVGSFNWLKAHASLPENLVHEMFAAKSDLSGDKLIKALRDDKASYNIAGKNCSALQLEIINSEELVRTRKDDILREIKLMEQEGKLDSIYLSILDLEKNFNIFITPNKFSQKILSETLGIVFEDDLAKKPGLTLRKETLPKIKALLEKHV